MKTGFFSRVVLVVLAASLVAGLSACSPQVATRGNLLDDYEIKQVLPGVDGKEDVMRKIGSPTTVAPFDDNTWFYIGQRTAKKGIFDPKVTKERIVEVKFSPEDGKVASVQERKDQQENVPIVQRTTPTQGNDFTVIQQVLGNLGKFNAPKQSAAQTAGGTNP